MRFKKVVCMALTAVMGAGMICTGVSAEEGSHRLTVWCWDPAFNINAMNVAAEIYQKDHPDFELEVVETPWPDVQTLITTAATAGDLSTLPDIFLMQDNAFQKNVISYPDVFADLSGRIDFSEFARAKTAYSVVEGKNYGVPFDNGTVIGCYRTDILEKAGLTLEDFTDITWDEYLENGKILLEETGTPLLSMTAGESDLIMMMLQSAGASLFDQEGDPAITGNEVLAKVAEIYRELVVSGVLIEVNSWDEYIQTINSGTVAGTINGCWIMASVQAAADQSGLWGITNLPSLPGVEGATNNSNNGGSSWAVTTQCQDLDLAADFLGSTFGGSVELYERILPSGALSTWLPAGESEAYGVPSEFFGGESVFARLTEYAGKTPDNYTGVYYYEARNAVGTAISNVIAGSDIDSELLMAEDTILFAMGK